VPVLNFVALTGKNLLYYEGDSVGYSTEAQMVLPPPGEWFILTIFTKDQSES